MRTPIDARFVAEAQEFSLRATCWDCVHCEASTGACSLSYPTEDHRLFPAKGEGAEFVFCKAFELG